VSDSTGPAASGTFSISITPTAPVVTNSGMTVGEGASRQLAGRLVASDPGVASSDLTYTLTAAPLHGNLQKFDYSSTNQAITLAANDPSTQADVDNDLVRYVHSDDEATSDSFGLSVTDPDGPATSGTFAISITPAPVALTNNGMTVAEGGTQLLTQSMLS